MKASVKVPATSANLGPGFDCLGIAVSLYNEITVEETEAGSGLEIYIIDENKKNDILSLPKDENNLAYKAIELLYNYLGRRVNGIKITIKANIPSARGLGSSASLIAGGLYAANEILGRPADNALLLSIASEAEGHPDNVTPALFGGFCISSMEDDGSVIYSKLNWPDKWKLAVIVPDYELDTRISRSVLPEKINMTDAAYNVRKCAMLIDAVCRQDDELMKKCLKDKMHQPYRENLIIGFRELRELLAEKDDILGCVVSGAGPSVLVISKNNGFENALGEINSIFSSLNVSCDIKTLNVEKEGAKII